MSTPIDGQFVVVPDTGNEPPELPPEDSVQAFVHQKRLQLVKAIMVKGVPDDSESRRDLLTTLKDMDTSALARKKIAADSKGTAQSAAAAAIIARVLGQLSSSTKPEVASNVPFVTPTLGSDVPPPELIEGETATQLPQESYASFMSKFAEPDEPK